MKRVKSSKKPPAPKTTTYRHPAHPGRKEAIKGLSTGIDECIIHMT